jgi:hypothetical protein
MAILRIVVADGHPVVLAGIKALLQATPGVRADIVRYGVAHGWLDDL